jgi:hypothetical protein
MITEVAGHGACITDIREGAGDDNPIEAGKYTGDFVLVSLNERIHDDYPLSGLLRIRIGYTVYFGSGYAGVRFKSCEDIYRS